MTGLWSSAEAAAATLGEVSSSFVVSGISIDTRTLRRGDLFVALQGQSRDGHAFLQAAFAAGAAAAMVSTGPANPNGEALLHVANTLRGLEDLARAARSRSHAKIIGVTGSAGKTTTKEMLRLACGALGKAHASTGSYNNHWGVPLSLASMPRETEFGVFEMGMNHFGEIRALVSLVKPHAALVTTIAPAHLEFFGTCEAIADAKSEIFEGVVPGGAAIVPGDSPYAERLRARARQVGLSQILSFGHGRDNDARLIRAEDAGSGMRVEAEVLGRLLHFRLNASGAHLASNALGALLSIAAIDGDVLNAAAALSEFTALKGRGARIAVAFQDGEIELLDESYNANPASVAAALDVLARTRPRGEGRRIAVLGDMLELGPDGAELHAGLANAIEQAQIDAVFLCGPLMRSLCDRLQPTLVGAYSDNSESLGPKVAAAVKPGDVVLVKGSFGSRMSNVITALQAAGAGGAT